MGAVDAGQVIGVLLVDDHPIVRECLSALLATVSDIAVLGGAGDGRTAIALAARHRPDVVLMDLDLPGIPGLGAAPQILRQVPGTAVLVLTMVDDDDTVLTAMRIAARGYLLEGAGQDELLGAIRTLAAGGAVVGAGLARHVPAGDREATARGSRSTGREAQIVSLLADGRTNGEIASELGIGLKTVQNHASRRLVTLQVRDRTQAALRMRGLSGGTSPLRESPLGSSR